MMNYGDKKYLTNQEAAQFLQRNIRTLDRYAQMEIIQRYYQEDEILYLESDLILLKSELEKVRSTRLDIRELKKIMDDHKK